MISKPVINLLAQEYPGNAHWKGGKNNRIGFFKQCLEKVRVYFKFNKNVTIGAPYRIGCGLAGGDWDIYREILERFNKNNKNITLILYKID